MTEIEFKNWIKNAWIDSGGLINQKTASLISGLSEAQISRKIAKNEIRSWKYKGMKGSFISFSEAMKLKRERAPKTEKTQNN